MPDSEEESETPPPAPPEKPAGAAEVDWKRESRKHEQRAKQAQDELEKLKAAAMSDTEKATEKAVKEATDAALAEADTRWKTRMVSAEVRAAAATKLTNPADAMAFIDIESLKWKGDELDPESLAQAVDELIKQRPYLALQKKTDVPPVPAGGRGTSSPISRDQLKTMTPEAINEARRRGDLDHLMKG